MPGRSYYCCHVVNHQLVSRAYQSSSIMPPTIEDAVVSQISWTGRQADHICLQQSCSIEYGSTDSVNFVDDAQVGVP